MILRRGSIVEYAILVEIFAGFARKFARRRGTTQESPGEWPGVSGMGSNGCWVGRMQDSAASREQ